MKNLRLTIRQIALMGVLVAMSIVMDTVFKIYQQANGGSINLAMVGLVLIALAFPWWISWLTIAIVFGGLTALIDGYIAYYWFDYFFALSGFALISLVRKPILTASTRQGLWLLSLGFFLAFLWRFFMHVISGVLYFEVDWVGSILYNVTYLFPSFILSFALILLLYFSSLRKVIRQITLEKMV